MEERRKYKIGTYEKERKNYEKLNNEEREKTINGEWIEVECKEVKLESSKVSKVFLIFYIKPILGNVCFRNVTFVYKTLKGRSKLI